MPEGSPRFDHQPCAFEIRYIESRSTECSQADHMDLITALVQSRAQFFQAINADRGERSIGVFPQHWLQLSSRSSLLEGRRSRRLSPDLSRKTNN